MRLLAFALWSLTALTCAYASARPDTSAAPPNQQAQRLMENLPMRFEQNEGQIHPDVRYFSRWGEYTLFLTRRQAVLALPGGVLRMSLRESNPNPQIEGVGPLGGRNDVLKGNRSGQWKKQVPQFRRVAYRDVYPGIDVVYYGAGRLLEHDFVVSPGADPRKIRMRFRGADQLRLDADGGLIMKVGGVELRQPKPYIYQQPEGEVERERVDGHYVLLSRNEVGFELGGYNRAETLVIDPVLMYSTYVGGTSEDVAMAMTTDPRGRIWITGRTYSADYPVTEDNNYSATYNADADIFVTAIDTSIPGRGSVVYSTFIGGSGIDDARAIYSDSSGNIYITGSSTSIDFPHGGNAYSISNAGERDAIIMKLNPNSPGTDILELSTYFGGAGSEYPQAITVDERNGTIWIAGYGTAVAPTTDVTGTIPFFGDSVQAANRGGWDSFIVNIDPAAEGASSILYSSYYGGGSTDVATSVKVDSQGRLYFGGYSFSSDFPVTGGAYRTDLAGGGDAFLAVLDLTRSGLDQIFYSTFFGGSAFDSIHAMALDPAGALVVAGYTLSDDLPTTGNAAQSATGGGADTFIMRFDLAGNAPVYSSYVGGSGSDVPYSLTLDSRGRAWLAGYTTSTNLPIRADSIQSKFGGGWDAFIARLDTLGTSNTLSYISYIGGELPDTAYGISVDAAGILYVAATTRTSNGIPITEGAYAGAFSGVSDAYVLKVELDPEQ